jgi:hypothetical protein
MNEGGGGGDTIETQDTMTRRYIQRGI